MGNKTIFSCAECGSTDVEYKMWVNPNTDVIGVDCEEEPYCNKCGKTTDVKVNTED